MTIRLTLPEEIPQLTLISKSAFDTDIYVGADEAGGPPEYDNENWHSEMLSGKHLYSILNDDGLIGGIILFNDERAPDVMYVGRIFISPALHHKGCGRAAMLNIEKMFPDIKFWRLDTPDWNTRTNSFYPSIGYKEMSRKDGFVYYQKQV